LYLYNISGLKVVKSWNSYITVKNHLSAVDIQLCYEKKLYQFLAELKQGERRTVCILVFNESECICALLN